MANSLLRTDKEIAEIYERHKKTVYRVCFAYMKNQPDTEDALQDTLYQLIRKRPVFESEEHERPGSSKRQPICARTVCGTGGANAGTWMTTRLYRKTGLWSSAEVQEVLRGKLAEGTLLWGLLLPGHCRDSIPRQA